MNGYRYRVFGLAIESNQPIPGLNPVTAGPPPDLNVVYGEWSDLEKIAHSELPWFESRHISANGRPVLRITVSANGKYFHFQYADGNRFMLDRQGRSVWVEVTAESNPEDAATYLLGPVLGFVLRLRGVVTLHASAVKMNGHGAAFVGPAHSGKSTLAAALVRSGYPLIAEDNVALVDRGDHFLLQPGFPRIRLWPQAVQALYGSAGMLPPAAPMWDKRHLDLVEMDYPFQTAPTPLATIYVLGRRTTQDQAPYIEQIAPRERLLALVTNTRENLFIDKEMRAKEFRILGRLTAHVRMVRIISHDDWSRLSSLCDLVVRDMASGDASNISVLPARIRPDDPE